MACLDEDKLAEFMQGSLEQQDARSVEQHVDSCPSCRLRLTELAQSSRAAFLDTLPHSDLGSPHAGSASGSPRVISTSASPRAASDAGASDPNAVSIDLQVDQIVGGRFRVVRFLGRGGMARVYEAEDLQLHERVALKLLRPEVKNLPQILDHLRHEVVLGRRISHPNVCRLYDMGVFEGNYFISMSLVPGESLASVLGRGTPPESWTLNVLLQICAALEAAHVQGVVHRDLKASNIMVDASGKVTVMDFGLARDLWGEPSQSGMLIGSPAYWSPEQACGHRATERSDIYSFGVVACELFGARRPMFGGKPDMGKVPVHYREAIRKCLEANPEDRFASVRELREALQCAAAKPGKRGKQWLVVAAGLLAGVLAASTGIYLIIRQTAAVTSLPSPRGKSTLADAGQPAVTAPGGPQARADARSSVAVRADARSSVVMRADAGAVARAMPISRRQLHRRRFARRKGTASAAPVIARVVPPPPVTPAAGPSPEELERKLRTLEQQRSSRGILPEDVSSYATALRDARRALGAKEGVAARAALQRMQQALEQTQIDRAFIERKLSRLNAAGKRDPSLAERVREIFKRVHERSFAGDYHGANKHLNTLAGLLQQKSGK